MLGASSLLGGLALGLTACVSASPLGLNATSNGMFTNRTTTVVTQSTTTLYDTVSLVPVTGSASSGTVASGPVAIAQDNSAPKPIAPQSGSSSSAQEANAGGAAGSVNAALAPSKSQSTSPAGFQTVVVTETVAGCGIGTSAPNAASPTVNGQAPFAVATTSSISATYAASTLLPAVHWDYPVGDIHNLAPSNSSNLYYSAGGVSDASIQHLFATLSTTLSYEAVVLDHSSFVSDTTCSADGIEITFTSTEAFNFAAQSWSAASNFVLVTYTDGCHGVSDQQRTFWLINSLQLLDDTLSIIAAVATELAIEDALHEVDLQWGTYYPPANGTNGTASSGNSASNSSGNGSSYSDSGSGNSGTNSSGSSNGSGGSSSSNSTSSSSSNSTANGATCGNAPASTIDGLPAASCGDANFDKDIDNAIGYLDFSSPSVDGSSLDDFLPGVTVDSADLADAEEGADLSRRDLEKRWWNPIKAVAHLAVSVVKTVATVATAPARLIATAVRNIPVVGDFIAKSTELDPSISGSKDFSFGPEANAESPWGSAAQIYTKEKSSSSGTASADVSIYCVNCGVKGHIALAGQAKFNVLDGLHGLNAAINANLEAGVNLGLVANAQYKDTKSKALIRAPLPEVGVAVKGVFSAGVYLSVDAVSTIEVTAEGQALVGVVMTIPNFQANINLFDQDSAGKSGISGLTPTFEKRFEASGQVAASLQLSLPIAINCGFEIPALSMKRAISLIEEPSLYGKLTVAGSTPNVAPASETCNNGIEYLANLQNDVKLDFLGLKTFDLNHYESPPLLQGCKSFGSKSSDTSAAASPTTDASTAAATDSPTTATTGDATTAAPTDPASQPTTTEQATNGAGSDGDATTAPTAAATGDASSNASDGSDSTKTDAVAAPSSTSDSSASDNGASDSSAAPRTTSGSDDSTPADTTDGTSATDASSQEKLRRGIIFRRDNSTSSADDVDNEDASFASSDSADETNDAVDDDSSDSGNAEFTADANEALDLSADEQSEDGITFTTLVDVQATFQLIPGNDGNLYAGAYTAGSPSDSGLFASYENIIVGDDQNQILHYYPDEMAVYNASRIRLSSPDVIPKTADAITLSPIDYDNSDSSNPVTYFAIDTKSNVYSLVLCDFSNGADSKVFIVNDQSGLDSLENNVNIKYTVTGAPVTSCYPLAMVSGGNGTTTS